MAEFQGKEANRTNVASIAATASLVRHRPSRVESDSDTRRTSASNRKSRQAAHSVTLRLRESIAQKLRTASIERSIEYEEPYTQQAITEAALIAWLERNGYSSEE